MINDALHKLAMAATFSVMTYGGLTSFSAAVWAVFTGSVTVWALTA